MSPRFFLLHLYCISVNILSYTDVQEISEYAIPAIQWAAGEGIMQGFDGKLSPKQSLTRAEMAAIMQRFMEISKR